MSTEIRKIRLANDYQELSNMKGGLLDWKIIRGIPPYVEEYELQINLKSPINTTPTFRNSHIVQLILPPSYPKSNPELKMLSSPKIAHPNWYPSGRWCIGSYNIRESLGSVVRRMMATIQFDPDHTNPNSPADRGVVDWYKRQLSSGFLPFDNSTLPDPKRDKQVVRKKTFKMRP